MGEVIKKLTSGAWHYVLKHQFVGFVNISENSYF